MMENSNNLMGGLLSAATLQPSTVSYFMCTYDWQVGCVFEYFNGGRKCKETGEEWKFAIEHYQTCDFPVEYYWSNDEGHNLKERQVRNGSLQLLPNLETIILF